MKLPRSVQFVLYILILFIPAAWLTMNILKTPTVDCEVCISFHGKEKCREASGPDKVECQKTATDNACAFLASGMTESIQCASVEPKRLTFAGEQK